MYILVVLSALFISTVLGSKCLFIQNNYSKCLEYITSSDLQPRCITTDNDLVFTGFIETYKGEKWISVRESQYMDMDERLWVRRTDGFCNDNCCDKRTTQSFISQFRRHLSNLNVICHNHAIYNRRTNTCVCKAGYHGKYCQHRRAHNAPTTHRHRHRYTPTANPTTRKAGHAHKHTSHPTSIPTTRKAGHVHKYKSHPTSIPTTRKAGHAHKHKSHPTSIPTTRKAGHAHKHKSHPISIPTTRKVGHAHKHTPHPTSIPTTRKAGHAHKYKSHPTSIPTTRKAGHAHKHTSHPTLIPTTRKAGHAHKQTPQATINKITLVNPITIRSRLAHCPPTTHRHRHRYTPTANPTTRKTAYPHKQTPQPTSIPTTRKTVYAYKQTPQPTLIPTTRKTAYAHKLTSQPTSYLTTTKAGYIHQSTNMTPSTTIAAAMATNYTQSTSMKSSKTNNTTPTSQQLLMSHTTTKSTSTTRTTTNAKLNSCHLCQGPKFICEILHGPSTCSSPDQQYCINDVENLGDGTRYVTRRCATQSECVKDWIVQSADRNECKLYSTSNLDYSHYTCSFCCQGDNCNAQVVPNLLYGKP